VRRWISDYRGCAVRPPPPELELPLELELLGLEPPLEYPEPPTEPPDDPEEPELDDEPESPRDRTPLTPAPGVRCVGACSAALPPSLPPELGRTRV
jgi:hypothetical protein